MMFYMNGEELVFTNLRGVIIKTDKDGNPIRGHDITTTFRAKITGETIEFVKEDPNDKGTKVTVEKFSGRRIPALPPKPDLSKVKFDNPIPLFNGKNLDGWKLLEPNFKNGWFVENG